MTTTPKKVTESTKRLIQWLEHSPPCEIHIDRPTLMMIVQQLKISLQQPQTIEGRTLATQDVIDSYLDCIAAHQPDLREIIDEATNP